MFPTEIKRAIPTARLEDGARELPIQETRQVKGQYRPPAAYGNGIACDDVWGALACQIGGPRKDEGKDSGENVDRDGHELGIGTRVAEALDDRWYGGRESV